jgi:hypothetical protein
VTEATPPPAAPGSPALPLPGLLAGLETHVRALALPNLLLLAWLIRLLSLLARHHPALARLRATLPTRRPQTSWQRESWGLSEDPDALDPSGAISLALARLLYAFGPRPRRGMRPLPNTRPTPRRTPPIRPPPRAPRASPIRANPPDPRPHPHDSSIPFSKQSPHPLAPPAPRR